MEEVLDPEAIEAYQEIAEEKGEEFKIPAAYKAPDTKEEDKSEDKSEDKIEVTEEESEEVKDEKLEEEEEVEEFSEEDSEDKEGEEDSDTEEVTAEELEKQIREIAVDEGLTIDQAKEKREARQNLLKKHDSDPQKLVKALHSQQSAYDKLKSEHTKLKDSPKYDEAQINMKIKLAQVGAWVSQNKDQLIEKARQTSPKKTENMDDSDIVKVIEEEVSSKIKSEYEVQLSDMKEKASQRRIDVIREISDLDKEFIPEVKQMIEELADNQVMSSSFDVMDFVKFARGEKYTPDYKSR